MSDDNGDQLPRVRDRGTNFRSGNDGTFAVTPTGDAFAAVPAQLRMALVSLLASAVGLTAGGGVAYLLYNPIGLFTNIFVYHQFGLNFAPHFMGIV